MKSVFSMLIYRFAFHKYTINLEQWNLMICKISFPLFIAVIFQFEGIETEYKMQIYIIKIILLIHVI